MKTDVELKRDVSAELAWDPAIRSNAIDVAVKDGIVTLSGHLESCVEKHAVERALRRVGGVRAIAIELEVEPTPQHKRCDTEIAAAAGNALKWHAGVVENRIRVAVESGFVRLHGEVDWDYQRRAVETAIRPLTGVVGISNEISLKPRPAPSQLAARIGEALSRQALREPRRVEVSVDGSTVTLRGKVQTWQERDAVQGAAWAAPGVRQVVNEVRIDA
jgi:osmotically-inducible protein OsmY